ncbi:family 18 glycoside hydrolase [Melampsora larici-populina 98AG31]|uniref:Family 18 glycoside hydrolase n=1 Tax=Melampsora larici-populina (strain 98AG31 / pathotype 3-4-7) TaxID=747676 RepID=F4S5W8_MELLP|nr:family 18 glycoside hydrolase [Melampsora larici-populina 98AG31]EGF99973.1 family 18 glycoside hydrolase [Melampsora larici-populina 98AG31]
MNRLSLLAFCAIVLLATFHVQGKHDSHYKSSQSKKVMGYYPAYNYKVQSPSQIPWSLYTDLTFFVAIPNLDGSFTYPPGLTSENAAKLAKEFVTLANSNKVLPAITYGGWTGSRYFSTMAKNKTNRKKYAKILIDFAKKFGFKGIDIDWEYPNGAGIGCNTFDKMDTVNLGLFLQEIRKQWPKAQLSSALGISGLVGASGSAATTEETKLVVKHLDFVKIMAYDVFGNWAATTGPIAPLYATCAPESPISVETAFQALVEQGFKPEKMVLGLPAYARSYELTSSKLAPRNVDGKVSLYYQNHTSVAPRGGKTDDRPMKDVCGVQTDWGGLWLVKEFTEKGYLSKDLLKGGNGYKRYFDKCSSTPFLTNGKYFFSYDDQVSVVAKAKYAKSKKLSGIYFFDTQGLPDFAVKAGRDALH